MKRDVKLALLYAYLFHYSHISIVRKTNNGFRLDYNAKREFSNLQNTFLIYMATLGLKLKLQNSGNIKYSHLLFFFDSTPSEKMTIFRLPYIM